MVDRYGLLTDEIPGLQEFKKPLKQHVKDLTHWDETPQIGSEQVIKQGNISVLIGVSGQPDLFTSEVVKNLCGNTANPIILQL